MGMTRKNQIPVHGSSSVFLPKNVTKSHCARQCVFNVFFFNDTATTEIYTLSLHDALPISPACAAIRGNHAALIAHEQNDVRDRKSTRLNSSHANISYAVFCLKKKKNPVDNDVASGGRLSGTEITVSGKSGTYVIFFF